MRLLLCAAMMLGGVAVPADAQVRDSTFASRSTSQVDDDTLQQQQQQQQPARAPLRTEQPGRVAESSVGRIGQRQTREQVAPNVQPMARVASRIQNRVQTRLHNRIDRYYDSRTRASDPFAVAEEQTRSTARGR